MSPPTSASICCPRLRLRAWWRARSSHASGARRGASRGRAWRWRWRCWRCWSCRPPSSVRWRASRQAWSSRRCWQSGSRFSLDGSIDASSPSDGGGYVLFMRLALLVAALAMGCGESTATRAIDRAPGDVAYLVHNQLWSIGLDGTRAHLVATVGDDARRTGFPRRLSDGRAALLADDTGAIFPFVQSDSGGFRTLRDTHVTLHDALCGTTIGR